MYTVKAAHHCVSEGAFADGVLYAEVALLVCKQRVQVATIINVLETAIKLMLASTESLDDNSEDGVAIDSSRHYLGVYNRLMEDAVKKYGQLQPETGTEITLAKSWNASFSIDPQQRGIVRRAPHCCAIT